MLLLIRCFAFFIKLLRVKGGQHEKSDRNIFPDFSCRNCGKPAAISTKHDYELLIIILTIIGLILAALQHDNGQKK